MASEKRKNKFTVEDELRLIHEVEKRPILWDSTSDNYKRADLKPQVWAEVATNVGPAFTGKFKYISSCPYLPLSIRTLLVDKAVSNILEGKWEHFRLCCPLRKQAEALFFALPQRFHLRELFFLPRR